MSNYSYLFILISAVLFPFIWSFEKKMYFFKYWKDLFKPITISALLFLLFDILYTYLGVWGFNPEYVIGLYIFNLPVEEVLFFFVVPFASMFIYETVYFLWRDKIKKGFFYQVSLCLGLFLFLFGLYHYDKLYTLFAYLSASLLLGYHCARKKQMNHEVFWVSFILILIPFLIVNGLLTGYCFEKPVVWYNDAENLGIRVLSIPIEDFSYGLTLILLNVTLYERYLKRQYQ